MPQRSGPQRSGPALLGLGLLSCFAIACESTDPAPGPSPTPTTQAPRDPDHCPLASADDPQTAFEAAFVGWSWSTLTPPRQAAVRRALAPLVQEGSPPWISLSGARAASLDAIEASEIFGGDTIAMVVGDADGFEGEGLSLDEREALPASTLDVVASAFGKLRYREQKDARAEAHKAALALGASPSTEALAEFSELFEAPLVLTLSSKVRFVPSSGDDPDQVGALHGRGQALVFHSGTGTVLARAQVTSEPRSLKAGEPLAPAARAVSRELGESMARELSARLFERFYAQQ